LDNLLAGNFDPAMSLRNLTGFSGKKLLDAKNDESLGYVGGHIPSGIFDLDKFKHKITVIRDPCKIIASLGAFSQRYKYDNPRLEQSLASQHSYHVYPSYFSERFDLNRMLLDYSYGIFSDIGDYIPAPGDVGQAISRLKQFNWIIDFSDLDSMARTLIVELGLFPLRKIDRRRASEYHTDLSLANKLVSPFDRDFYVRSRELFTKPRISQANYDQYRQDYTHRFGVTLAPWSDIEFDLREPIGQMWHLAEISELGKWYRWSEQRDVTLELPIKHPGVYEITVYARNSTEATLVNLRPEFTDGGELLFQELVAHEGLVISKNLVKLASSGWVDFFVDIDIADNPNPSDDDRNIGIALGDIYIRRLNDL
jgi:hypothetical protein